MTGLAILGAEDVVETEGVSEGIAAAATCSFNGYFLRTGFIK